MRRFFFPGVIAITVGAVMALGLYLVSGASPVPAHAEVTPEGAMPQASAPAPERKVLYWKAPDGTPRYSAVPAQTPDGRNYLPVHDDEEPGFAGKPPSAKTKTSGSAKILYYRNPMGLPDTSPVPKKDWMGMDYIPVHEGEEGGSAVTVSLDRVQRSGVRTALAEMRLLSRPVRAPGIAKPDERTLYAVTLRADGFIEKLYVNETGSPVKAGEPLFRIYSPQMVQVQVDYRSAATTAGPNSTDVRGAIQRLKNLDLPETVLRQLRESPEPRMSIDWPSPVGGVVMRKNVIDGQMVRAGEELYRIADLSSIWVIADVPEQDIGLVNIGDPAQIAFSAIPGESFAGRVTFILHELDPATRTAKVRVELKNPKYRIRHEMYADVVIETGTEDAQRLAVPRSAVIDSGARQIVLVDRGEGRFEPRDVKLGRRGQDFIEVREGIDAGEAVVVSANFLIDAESNLKAALQSFVAAPPPEAKR